MKNGKYPFQSFSRKGSDARRMRRMHLKDPKMRKEILKMRSTKDKSQYFEYLRQSIEYGNQIHEENVNEVREFQKDTRERIAESIKKHFRSLGYSSDKIKNILATFRSSFNGKKHHYEE